MIHARSLMTAWSLGQALREHRVRAATDVEASPLAVGVLVLRHQVVAECLLRGRPPRTVRRRLLRTVGQAFDVLETGFGEMMSGGRLRTHEK